jgi:sugar lactone lactonase YvrE
MKNYTATRFSPEKYRLGEGPFYDVRSGCLSWVDILDGKIYTMSTDGRKECFETGGPIGAAVPIRNSNGFIGAMRDGLYRIENGNMELWVDLSKEYRPYQRSNDAKADPMGRLWFGSANDAGGYAPSGNLYCYDRGELRIMQANTKIANGMAWSRDGKRFFFSDSLEHAVFSYDFDMASGKISNREVLFCVENGVPDGMCIDADDDLWVAIWGGRRVECRDSVSGEKLSEISVPAENVSSCCFYGEKLDMLLITTSGEWHEGPEDGCLFTCRVDATGVAPDMVKV